MHQVEVRPGGDRPEPHSTRRADTLAPSANGWSYRPQLDGLRAIAVYLVVAFHAGFELFEGGFIGVDLFFVLSGFLVTNVLLTSLAEDGSVRLRVFYARRIRRLLPAATMTILLTALMASLMASPIARDAWSNDAQAASLWYANWHFLGESTDYFAANDAESPYLHFWSLAIEEQFYLVFPLLLLALWRVFGRRLERIVLTVAVLLAAGVALQVYWNANDSGRAYLGTDARLYQLLVGVLLALVVWRHQIPERLRKFAQVGSLGAIGALVFIATSVLDVTASHRGLIAAVVSGALVLLLQTTTGGAARSFLSAPPIRYLGQISYGTYLWHWPVLILARQVLDFDAWTAFLFSAGIGTALAALSSALLEEPIRRTSRLDARPLSTIAVGVATAVAAGLFLAPALLDTSDAPAVTASGPSARVDGPSQPVPDLDWAAIRRDTADAPACAAPDASDCVIVEGDERTVLLIGDSHARMLIPPLTEFARSEGFTLAADVLNACPWMRNAYRGDSASGLAARCISRRSNTYDVVVDRLQPDLIVVATNTADSDVSNNALGSVDHTQQGIDVLEPLATASTSELAQTGQVLIVEPTPVFDREDNPLQCLSIATTADQCTVPPTFADADHEIIRRIAADDENVTSFSLDPELCPRLPVCDPLQFGVPVWRDRSHLSTDYAIRLSGALGSALQEAGLEPRS